MRGYTGRKDKVQRRLRRIEGQVRGLQRMVGEDKYCIDILTQMSAATKALQSVALGLLDDHLAHCVAAAGRAMTSATYQVSGMTCEHCARAVTAKLKQLGGVSDVTVGLVPGGVSAVTVTSEAPLDGR